MDYLVIVIITVRSVLNESGEVGHYKVISTDDVYGLSNAMVGVVICTGRGQRLRSMRSFR